jgi:hypothetical protein
MESYELSYLNWATSVPGVSAGKTRSGGAGGGSAFIRPGRRKVAGETLCVVLMPLHPATANKRAESTAHPMILRFNLIKHKYRVCYDIRNI